VAPDRYDIAAGHCQVEIPKIKGSRFIGEVYPVASVEDAEARLSAVRKAFHDATHHCYAYRLGVEGDVFRSSDDGEPSGSAGAPILRQLESSGLSDTLVVVVRYYGGTKLGTGGLVRAYGAAAEAVLNVAERKVRQLFREVSLRFGYDDTAPVMRLVDRYEARIVSSRYGTDTVLKLAVPQSSVDKLLADFIEDLGGRGTQLDG